MNDLVAPNPIIDAREAKLLVTLTEDYRKFTAPGLLTKGLATLQKHLGSITPEKLTNLAGQAVEVASESEFIKAAITHAGRGFQELVKQASWLTKSHASVLGTLNSSGIKVRRFEHICCQRSYHLEKAATALNYVDVLAAFGEGAVTGFPGLLGLPFNIALSFFLYFRAAQSIALYYGYDVTSDPRELEFASEATLFSLAPTLDTGAETLGGIIGKMMVAAEVSALKHSLATKTYGEIAKRGGAELLYVQVRALANKAAANALRGAGEDGLEAGVFRKTLERVGRQLPKNAGAKGVPFIGALIGGLADSYYMSQVLRGSNLVYHKRFLFEKEERVRLL